MIVLKSLLLFYFISFNVNANLPSCKDWNNNDVDWFIAYKLPKNINPNHPTIELGTTIMYADANNRDFVKREDTMNHANTAVAYTVQRALDAQNSMAQDEMYAFYNNERPGFNNDPASFAHGKGFLNFNKDQGFWVMHTVPKFPDTNQNAYTYPSNRLDRGQMFFCVTFGSEQLGEIAAQLIISRFNYYSQHVPNEMRTKWPLLQNAILTNIQPDAMKNLPYWRSTKLISKGRKWFDNFQKYDNAVSDIYANQIAQFYKQSFYVQFYPDRATGAIDFRNVCGRRFNVKNIRGLKYKYKLNFPVVDTEARWSNTKDHSKWAISVKSDGDNEFFTPTICFGDLNRQTSQAGRGGGAMCMQNSKIWKFFDSLIDKNKLECCNSNSIGCEDIPHNSVLTPERAQTYKEYRRT